MSLTAAAKYAPVGAQVDNLTPSERPTLAEARSWCRELATSPYENRLIATFLLPRKVRSHLESIYAYRRVAADLGGKGSDPVVAIRMLDVWEDQLKECYEAPERSKHPVFVALHEILRECDPPRHLLFDLLHAFRMDQYKKDYETWDELLEYSHYSANPLGRLVLWVCGYTDESLGMLSDKVCTALQLTDFWQDVVEDAELGSRYIPAESMLRFGVEEGQIEGRVFTPEFGAMMQELVARTRVMLLEGWVISSYVDRELKVLLDLFQRGGEEILNGITRHNFDVLRGSPVVSNARKAGLLMEALIGKLRAGTAP